MHRIIEAMKKREMALVGKKMTFAEAEDEDLFQWLNVSFEEKWKSLERMRKTFYKMHGLPFPEKMVRIIERKNGIS